MVRVTRFNPNVQERERAQLSEAVSAKVETREGHSVQWGKLVVHLSPGNPEKSHCPKQE